VQHFVGACEGQVRAHGEPHVVQLVRPSAEGRVRTALCACLRGQPEDAAAHLALAPRQDAFDAETFRFVPARRVHLHPVRRERSQVRIPRRATEADGAERTFVLERGPPLLWLPAEGRARDARGGVHPERSVSRNGTRLGLGGFKPPPPGGRDGVLSVGHFGSWRIWRLFRVVKLDNNRFCVRVRLHTRAGLMSQGGWKIPGVSRALRALVSSGFGLQSLLLALRLPLPPTVVAVLEHVQALGVQGPVASFAGPPLLSGHLDEAVIQGQVVADGVLPALLVVVIEREPVHDELVDAAERRALLRRALDGHGDERDVAVRRLLRRLLAGRHEAQPGGHDPSAVPSVQVDERRWTGEAQSRGRQAAVV